MHSCWASTPRTSAPAPCITGVLLPQLHSREVPSAPSSLEAVPPALLFDMTGPRTGPRCQNVTWVAPVRQRLASRCCVRTAVLAWFQSMCRSRASFVTGGPTSTMKKAGCVRPAAMLVSAGIAAAAALVPCRPDLQQTMTRCVQINPSVQFSASLLTSFTRCASFSSGHGRCRGLAKLAQITPVITRHPS